MDTHKYRVLNLIARDPRHPLGLTWQQRGLRRLLHWQPEARRIRFAGKCPHCKNFRLWSFQLPAEEIRGQYHETCGYYCGWCGWGNAGSREVSQRMSTKEGEL